MWQEWHDHHKKCILVCSWKECGKEFIREDNYKKHNNVHPLKEEEDPPVILENMPLNGTDIDVKNFYVRVNTKKNKTMLIPVQGKVPKHASNACRKFMEK